MGIYTRQCDLLSCFLLIWIAVLLRNEVEAIKILIFVPGTTDWEKKPMNRIAQDLAFRNHEVTTFRAIIIPEEVYLVKQKVHGAREMRISAGVDTQMTEAMSNVGNEIPFIEAYDTVHYNIPSWTAHTNACDTVLNSDLLIKFRQDKFDVALVYSGNPCNLALVWSLNVPYIYFDVEGFSDDTMMAAGVPLQPNKIPSSKSTYSSKTMNFMERWHNIFLLSSELAAFSGIPFLAKLMNPRYKLLDGPVTDLFRSDYELSKIHPFFPDVSQIKQDAALYFVNSDPSIEFSGRAGMPNIVHVGGQHIDLPKPLFDPYNSTNHMNPKGVIIFSLGTVANSTAMPPSWREAFKTAFRKLKGYRVYWRISSVDEDVSDLPPNVNASLFLPQADLIGYEDAALPDTKLLITNGGMNSLMEAVAYGKPVVGIPLYGPNYHNLRKLEAKGMAKILDKTDINPKTLLSTIEEVLNDVKYRQSARRISRAYRDTTQTAFERLIYWIEKVGRSQGAEHLANHPAKDQSLLSALFFDIVLAGLLLVLLARFVGRFILNRLLFSKGGSSDFNSSTSSTKSKTKSNRNKQIDRKSD